MTTSDDLRTALAETRVVITGGAGQLGQALRWHVEAAGAVPITLGRLPASNVDLVVDITDRQAVHRALSSASPAIVIHAAAYTDVDGCERDPARGQAVNVEGSVHIAATSRAIGARLLMVSTDFVFAGDGGAPYAEAAQTGPISVYGRTKLQGEEAVLAADPSFAVARTAWLYGGSGKHFPRTVLSVVRDRGAIQVVTDETGSPTFVDDLAVALVRLAAVKPTGIYHLTNEGSATRFEFAQVVVQAAGVESSRVQPTTSEAFLAKYPLPARRPMDSTLLNMRALALGIRLRPWQDAVASYVPMLATELGLGVAHETAREN